jgi:hypothetical protein
MEKIDLFINKIQSDLGWRKKEVTNLLLLETEENHLIIIKSTLLLLYSHWEGFVKNTSKLYLEYISDQNIGLNDLTNNFKAITLKGLIGEVHQSSNTLTLINELKFIEKFTNGRGKKFTVKRNFSSFEKDKSIINTQDNLSLTVFKSILLIVGIDYASSIDTKATFIDEKLLGSRNKVAHGNRIQQIDSEFNLTLNDLKEVKDVVFFLMDSFLEDIIFFSEEKLYLSTNITQTEEYIKSRIQTIEKDLP